MSDKRYDTYIPLARSDKCCERRVGLIQSTSPAPPPGGPAALRYPLRELTNGARAIKTSRPTPAEGHMFGSSCHAVWNIHSFTSCQLIMAQRLLARPTAFRCMPTRTRPFSTVIDAPVDPRTQQITPSVGKRSVFEDAVQATAPRTNWTRDEISQVYSTSLMELTYASVC